MLGRASYKRLQRAAAPPSAQQLGATDECCHSAAQRETGWPGGVHLAVKGARLPLSGGTHPVKTAKMGRALPCELTVVAARPLSDMSST